MLSLLWKQNRFRLIALSYCALIAACAVNPTPQKPNGLGPDQLAPIAPMPIEVSGDQPLSASLKAGKSVTRANLVEGVYQSQEKATMASMNGKDLADFQSAGSKEARSRMHQLIGETTQAARPNLPGKKEIDRSLEKSLGKPLAYDPKLTTVQSVLLGDGLQCDSGTVLYLLVKLSGGHSSKFKAENPVVLAEDGHYLPGQLLRLKSGKFRLIGTEMTADGGEIIDYGYADQLETNPRVKQSGLRVLDATTFLAMEAVGDSFKTDQDYSDYELLALKKTAQRYGIHFDKLEAIVDQIKAKHQSPNGTRRRPVAFGDAGNPPRLEKRAHGTGVDSISQLPPLAGETPPKPVKGNAATYIDSVPTSFTTLVTPDNFATVFELPSETVSDREIQKLFMASLGVTEKGLRIPTDLINSPVLIGPQESVNQAVNSANWNAQALDNLKNDQSSGNYYASIFTPNCVVKGSLKAYFQEERDFLENAHLVYHFDKSVIEESRTWKIHTLDVKSKSHIEYRG